MDQEATLLQKSWAPRLLGNLGARLPSISGWMDALMAKLKAAEDGTVRQLSSARAKPEGGTTSTTSTSMRRVDGVLAFVESGKPGKFFVSDEVCASTEKFIYSLRFCEGQFVS